MNIELIAKESLQMIDVCSQIRVENLAAKVTNLQKRQEKMLANYDAKIKLNRALAIQIEEEERRVEELRTLNENLNVEYIRIETHHKKLLKSIDKLKSFNASRVKLDIGENDKIKICKSNIKLKILKILTSTFINSEMKGFSMDLSDNSLRPFQPNSNLTKETIREALWDNIADTIDIDHRQRWNALF